MTESTEEGIILAQIGVMTACEWLETHPSNLLGDALAYTQWLEPTSFFSLAWGTSFGVWNCEW